MNKKGLSTVVTTLIIVMMSLVAVGIVWVVIQNMTKGGSEQIDYSSKCLVTEITPQSASYNASTNLTTLLLKRSAAGGEETTIGGVKLTFTNADGTTANEDSTGNIQLLATKSYTTTTNLAAKPTKITTTVFFLKTDGTQYLCPSGSSLETILQVA